ncbi:InlB B-repeat-containing protein [Butyricicoccus pullicaecorum]|nr:S-layer homology domain-containing protein [Butyricicoccus pullicaecorum]
MAEIGSYGSLTQAIAEAPDGQDTTIQLTGDIREFTQTIEIPANKIITLDLNGYTIACVPDAEISAITVEGTLTLIDTSTDGNGTITGGQGGGDDSRDKPNFGGSVYVSSDAIFNMKGGHISGNNYSDLIGGCGVYVHWNGTFNLSGGYIENNILNKPSSSYNFGGAGVLVQGGTFNMTDGTIQENAIERTGTSLQASEFGAGVLIKSVKIGGTTYSATFNMSGGEITNNRVNNSTGAGAGVAVGCMYNEADSSTFTMTGGRISNNTIDAFGLSTSGGGVFCGGNMNISDSAVISENTATSTNSEGYGGGVYCTPFAVLNMSGGEITQNTATRKNSPTSGDGGGIYISGDNSSSTGGAEQYAFFTMTDGEITENSAGGFGGGVCFVSRARNNSYSEPPKPYNFIISGGDITGNTAGKMAGGIYYNGDLFQRTGGKLCNNTAGNDGDDIIIDTDAYPHCIELGEVGDDWTLGCGHSVDGWYIDGDAIHGTSDIQRWNATVTDGTNTSYCRPKSSTGYVKGFTRFAQREAYAIKAAHGNLAVSYFPLKYDQAGEGETYPMTATSQSFKENTKVLLQLDGGTLASQTGGSYNSADNTWTITMSQAITVGHPTKDGYYFTGWQVVTGSGSSEYELVLAPRWISKDSLGTITVRFDLDGGTTTDGKEFFEIQVTLPYENTRLDNIEAIDTAKDTPITKAEFIFDGWRQVTTGDDVYTQPSISIETPPDAVVVYQAIWEADTKYTINFDSQGGTPVTDKIGFYQSELDGDENQIALYKELQAFNRPVPTRPGYKLDYWYFDLLEYCVDNNLIEEDDNIVVKAQAARTQAKQKYAAGQITEAQYWVEMEKAYYYNIDAWIDANEPLLSEGLQNLGLGSELGYGLGCYLALRNFFETIPSITLTAKWTIVEYTLSYNLMDGVGAEGVDYASKEYTVEDEVEVLAAPTKQDYVFTEWNTAENGSGTQYHPGDPIVVSADITLYAQWKKEQYQLTYVSNGGTEYPAENYDKNTEVTLDKIPTRDGYTFQGWYVDESLQIVIKEIYMDDDKTVYAKWKKNSSGGAQHPEYKPEDKPEEESEEEIVEEDVPLAETPWLNTEDHYAYIIGYAEDGTVRPQSNITRAEVATIFFRLLTDEARDQFWSTSNNFSDVTADAWYNNAVSTMVNAGIIQGYEDGTFRPNNNITRAEFAAIASRFMSSGYDVEKDLFSDIASHWARESINDAAMTQWIHGYPDGTFLPNKAITRAEAVTLVNNVLQRKPDADHMLDSMIKWPDNMDTSAWYYEAIQEATNSHDYDLFEGAEYETWTALQENRDWAALEKDWLNAHRTGGEVM